MTEIAVTSYVFNPTAATVTFSHLTVVDPARVVAIYDTSVPTRGQEFGTVLYLAEDAPQVHAVTNVLTLPKDRIPAMATAADVLKISYNIDAPNGWSTLTFVNVGSFPATGVGDLVYLAVDTGQLYVWDGAAFVAV